MNEFDPIKYKQMVRDHQKNDDPTGWCNSVYEDAQGDYKAVFWADLEASPYLLQWCKDNPIGENKKTAIVIGCGVGDDAQALDELGYKVTAFDISPEAIKLCKNRYPNSKVDYFVADLFDYPQSWIESFDLIYECNTIQVLPGKYRIKARRAISSLASLNAHILVSCRSRNSGEKENEIPLPLDRKEIDEFIFSDKLTQISFKAYNDNQETPIPHFFVVYKRV